MRGEPLTGPSNLFLEQQRRLQLWSQVFDALEDYVEHVDLLRVSPSLDVARARSELKAFDFRQPLEPSEAIRFVVESLRTNQVQVSHPRYFGLFNPAPATMGIVADTLAAAFNCQLAAWAHCPFGVEVERHLVRALGEKFGYADGVDGTFSSGGAESNHTAMLCALVQTFPDFAREGVRALRGQPVFYVSSQGHHTFVKAARFWPPWMLSIRTHTHSSGLVASLG